MSADPFLIASLAKLRDEFNAIAPARDKTSDGWIGDTAHQQESSDHNDDETGNVPIHDADSLHEVHAIDVDRDLRLADVTMEDAVQFLLTRCKSGAETRLRYIIFNRRIWEASNGWRQRTYTGKNPHDHHAHYSNSYDSSKESNTRSWGLEDEFMAIDYDKIRTIVRDEVRAAVAAIDVPTAKENAEAGWNRTRTDTRSPWSDTAVNRLEAEITEAVVAGDPVERYPNNPKP